EAFRVLLVVGPAVILEGHEIVAVEGFRRPAAHDDDITLVQLQPHGALDILLAFVDRRLQHQALRREPEAVIDQLGIARHQFVLEMSRAAVQRDRFDGAVRGQKDRASRGFIDTTAFHAYEPVFDEVEPADAVVAAEIVKRGQHGGGRLLLSVQGNGIAPQELDLDLGCLVGGFHRRDGALVDEFRRLDPRVFQHLALRGGVQQVGVDREGRIAALVLGDRNLVLLGEVQKIGARLEGPVAPGRDHLDVGVQRIGRQFEANLVIALASCAVSDGVRTRFPGDFDQSLRDQRPRNGSAKQVKPLILRIGAKHREYEIADKFFAYILDVDFLDTEHLCLPARRLKVAVALTEVGGESDDFGAQLGLQPFQDDGGVEAARIGEYDLLYVFQLGHLCRFRDQVSRARYHAPSRFGKRRADRVARCRSNVPAEYFILLEKALRSVPRHASGAMSFIPDSTTLIQFTVASVILAITPGPDMTLFVSRTLSQ